MDWIVTGECTLDGSWQPFETRVQADTRQKARWIARREVASGVELASIDGEPVGVERQRVEITQGDRREARTSVEDSEYDRLVQTVRIESVEEA